MGIYRVHRLKSFRRREDTTALATDEDSMSVRYFLRQHVERNIAKMVWTPLFQNTNNATRWRCRLRLEHLIAAVRALSP